MAKAKTWLFEGQQRTIREIHEQFFPAVGVDTLRNRIEASKATTRQEMIDYLAKPIHRPTAGKNSPRLAEAIRAQAADATERRFSREARAKADTITGTKGCNYCQRVKPIAELTPVKRGNGRTGLICDTCARNRSKARSAGR